MNKREKLLSQHRNYPWLSGTTLVAVLLMLTGALRLNAQTYPSGFSQVKVASVSYPTAIAFAPDGRIFVAEKAGKVRIIKNGVIQSSGSPFLQVNVSLENERGIGGIALDPDFATNGYVYLYYTTASSPIHNRLSRFKATGDFAGSETVLIDFEPVTNAIHNGGGMAFGPDGKLYLGMGDDKVSANAQDLTNHKGKLLRLNKDGSTPSDNPYATSSNPATRRIWAYGFRNPYTISIQRGTGKIFVNDVGEGKWEEINDATQAGRNFGWPAAEGKSSSSAHTNPVFAYNHWDTGSSGGCAISGGAFFNPVSTNYPPQYNGKYFFMDYCEQWINYIDPSSGTPTKTNFATNINSSGLALGVGTDGNIYYYSLNTSSLYKIVYSNNNAPAITSNPSSITVSQGQPASFSVTASGANPLSYQWQKNGVNIAGATSATYTISSVQTSHAGQYRAIVTNAYGSATSRAATLTVTAYNAKPVASIMTPAANATYAAGTTISFSGNATDPEDGTLPASAFSWIVDFHHDAHSHPGPYIQPGVKNGSFNVASTGETASNVFYRLWLIVTDSKGLKDSAYTDIHPRLSTISFSTQPSGLKITFDGQPQVAPWSRPAVEGMQIPMGVVSPQTFNGKNYVFDRWMHGGSASQNITVPVNDTSFTAVFREDSTLVTDLIAANETWKYLDNGSNQGTAWRGASFNDGTWKTGNAQLGYGDGDEATVVSYGADAAKKHITTYFRKTFNVADKSAYTGLKLELMRDDGAVVYINGQEVYRTYMPVGTIAYNTFASGIADGASESSFITTQIGTSALVNGTNVIAVEIHQSNYSSSDLSFNLKLTALTSGGGGGGPVDPALITAGELWKYLDNGSNQGTAWRAPSFADGTWKTGNAQLGYGDGDEATVVSFGPDATKKYITTYFRKSFNVADKSAFTALKLELIRDDGAVVYINGQEVSRNNMPAGSIAYNTFAAASADGASESTYVTANMGTDALVNGTNVIAVEIHQSYYNSSDISFNLKLTGVTGTTPTNPAAFIPAGSSWKYLDNGTDQGIAWTGTMFGDSGWKTGNAQLGYGDGDEATKVSFGPSSTNKYITTYFRKTFQVADASAFTSLFLELKRDDGAVIYLNGNEIYRNNMPVGPIAYNTLASHYVDGTAEAAFIKATLSSQYLVTGTNVLAVEVHQSSVTSSDISFDLKLSGGNSSRLDAPQSNDGISGPEPSAEEITMDVFPNPSNAEFNVQYTLTGESSVTLEVFDVLGKLVHTILPEGTQEADTYNYRFAPDKHNLDAEIYFIKLTVDGKSFMTRAVYLK